MAMNRLIPFYTIAALFSVAAHAEAPPGSTGEYAEYFKGLKVPGSQAGCCSDADCRVVKSKFENGQWFAFISEEIFGKLKGAPDDWVPVPVETIQPPYTGKAKRPLEAISCWYMGRIRCFAKPDTAI